MPSFVYLLHFDKPIGHSQHYLGFTTRPVVDRVQEHIDGKGAALPREATRRSISPECVRVWEDGTTALERSLKKRKNSRGLCPICRPKRNAYERNRRAKKKASTPCGVPSCSLGPCNLLKGHTSEMHVSHGDGFYANCGGCRTPLKSGKWNYPNNRKTLGYVCSACHAKGTV